MQGDIFCQKWDKFRHLGAALFPGKEHFSVSDRGHAAVAPERLEKARPTGFEPVTLGSEDCAMYGFQKRKYVALTLYTIYSCVK